MRVVCGGRGGGDYNSLVSLITVAEAWISVVLLSVQEGYHMLTLVNSCTCLVCFVFFCSAPSRIEQLQM